MEKSGLPSTASRPPTRAGTAYLATVCPPMPTVGAGSSQREDSPARYPPACVFPPILEWPPIVTINRDAAHRVVTLPFAVSHLCPSGRKWRSVPRCYPIANPPCAYAHPPQPSTKWVRPIGRTHFLGRMESLSVQLWPLSPPWPLGATSPPRRLPGPVYHL